MSTPGAFQESTGSTSMRRILACVFTVAAIALFVLAFKYAAAGWFVFIPGLACLVAVVLLLFFTTWADVAEVASKLGR